MGLKIESFLILLYATAFTSVLSAPPISTTESLVVLTSEQASESSTSKANEVLLTSEQANESSTSKANEVVLTSEQANESTTSKTNEVNEKIPKIPKIYSMKVNTNVTNRFATTLVTSKVKNLDEKAQEANFAVVLPETAYISGFVMEIDGKKYEAYVKEKEEAKQIYNNAVSSGVAAAHVEVNARDSNRFTVSVNIEPQSKATFYLTYEELLKRQKGAYDIVINLHPGQPIKDLGVEVNINETRPLSFVKAPALRSGNEIGKNDEKLDPKASIERYNETAAKVTFNPDLERQKELATYLGSKEETGLAGQFVVQYDVQRDPHGGEVLISDGYFVHFFAPSDLKPLEKHVVFVLDTSGSMSGLRIQQLKQAMKSILGQLQKDDSLNIIDFNSVVNAWNIPKVEVQYIEGEPYYDYDDVPIPQNRTNQVLPDAFPATEDNIKHAEKVIEKLEAYGGTDIKSSLVVALQLLNETKNQRSKSKQPIVIFLTDGEATIGEYGDQAINSITSANTDDVPIFSLSFGDGADRDFLEKISLKNQGFARHIYEGADASLQLEEFYKYVSSPLLTKVNFKYVSNAVSKLTKTEFPIMFDGSEIVVAGILDPQRPMQLAGKTSSTEASESSTEKSEVNNEKPASSTEHPEINNEEPSSSTEEPIINNEGTLIDPLPCSVVGTGDDGEINFEPKFEHPVGSLEKHWAYLTLKQLFDERDAAENKTQYTKKALEIALKYSFVTPVSSLVVVKPNDTKAEANPEDASKAQPEFDSVAFASAGSPGAVQFMSPIPLSGASSYETANLAAEDDPSYVADRIFVIKSEGDRIVGGNTTEASSTQSETLSALKLKLPWLNNILDLNETLDLPNGKYKLGLSAVVDSNLDCPLTPLNGTGICTLLKDCPEVYNKLTDVKVYTNYFCPLSEFAGICCPKKTAESTSI